MVSELLPHRTGSCASKPRQHVCIWGDELDQPRGGVFAQTKPALLGDVNNATATGCSQCASAIGQDRMHACVCDTSIR